MIFFNNFNPKWSQYDFYGVHSLIPKIIIDFLTRPKMSFYRILPYIWVQAWKYCSETNGNGGVIKFRLDMINIDPKNVKTEGILLAQVYGHSSSYD